MKTNTTRRLIGMAAVLFGLALASPAAAVQCGDTIGPNVNVTLSGTLVCDDAPYGLTVVGPARVTMAGLLIVCEDLNQNGQVPSAGIRLLGRNVRVQGTAETTGVTAFCRNGVDVAGEGRHRIEQVVTVDGAGSGFMVSSGGNVLAENETSNMGVGFRVAGGGNDLQRNSADASGNHGFFVTGDRTRLTGNTATESDIFGFYFRNSTGHRVKQNVSLGNHNGIQTEDVTESAFRRNVVLQNGRGVQILRGQGTVWVGNEVRQSMNTGIFVDSSQTRLIANEVIGNLGDLATAGADCGTNVWRRNVFGTANRSCIQ